MHIKKTDNWSEQNRNGRGRNVTVFTSHITKYEWRYEINLSYRAAINTDFIYCKHALLKIITELLVQSKADVNILFKVHQ